VPKRRFEVTKAERLKKQTAGSSEMEEGEVAPDAEPKARPAAVEHQKQVELLSRAKDKGMERGKVKKLDPGPGPGVPGDKGTQGKGATGAADLDNAGKEEGHMSINGMLAEAGKPIDEGTEKSSMKVEEEVSGGHEVHAQDVVATDASNFGLSTSPMQHEVLQGGVNQPDEATNSVDVVGLSTSSSILNEVIQEKATTQEETVNDINDAKMSAPSSQGVVQDEVMMSHKTGSAADDVGMSTSPVTRQEVVQEEALALDSTSYAADEVGKLSGMPQQVLQEEVMKQDGTSVDVHRIETDTSSDLLREATQEKLTIPDETAHNTALEPVSYSGLLKEAMCEGQSMMDATGNTIDVAGRSNLADVAEDVMPEKAAVQETTNAVSSTGESNTFTVPQREVSSLQPQAPEIKEFEKLTVEMDKPTEHAAFQPAEQELEMDQCRKRGASKESMIDENEADVLVESIEKQVIEFDIETADGSCMFGSTKEHVGDSKEDAASANVMTRDSMSEDKGNGIAFDVLNKKVKVDHSTSAGRGLDSALQLGMEPTETSISASIMPVKQENDTMKLGKLDLSLSLSGCLQNSEFKCSIPQTSPPVHAACSQPLPSSSFRTNSDGFAASKSLTSSPAFGHNPSCSLTQQSLDNYEHSVGSKPFFMGIGQMSNHTGRQAQLSSESTQKGSATPLLQRVLLNGHMPETNTLAGNGIKGRNNVMSNDLRRHANIPGVLSPTHSRGSHDSGSEHNRQKRQLTREKSSSSLTRGDRQEGEQLVINGAGVIERIISKVVSEPLHLTGRMLQEMTENSITYLREAISDIIVDPGKREQIIALQEALKKRSDLNSDMLRMCPRVLMEILVAIKTGLPYFIKKSSSIATSNLVDIFLNLKCCNLSCQSILPVDDCDCKVCQRKTGFCSSCMCIVCSKFDSASNTCSWVGCDVCLHWCHTDCGLRHSLIRKGQSASMAYGTTEMQFHCAACGHPSEMFGFVKEVFRTCAQHWRMETLMRELQYVERIFSASDDARGKRVRNFVKQMLIKSENKAYHPEVVKCVTAFFSGKLLIIVNEID
jgi:hypothetical protein